VKAGSVYKNFRHLSLNFRSILRSYYLDRNNALLEFVTEFTSLRPGKKLYEELITEGEGIVRTPYDKIFVLKGESFDLKWLHPVEY
jgi:FlaA1/EpsC-like NDP-sugar epimerase